MRVLIACDGSEIAESAARVVASWGHAAAIDLFSVVDPIIEYGSDRAGHTSPLFTASSTAHGTPSSGDGAGGQSQEAHAATDDRTSAIARVCDEQSFYLSVLADKFFPGREVGIDVAVSEEPARAITERAAQIHADLIAVGSHGRGGLARAVMGSVAEKLLREGPLPVLVVGPNARKRLSDPQ